MTGPAVKRSANSKPPLCSVILCAKDDEKRISGTLQSILRQTCLGEIELIIVDGASTDGTLSIVRDAMAAVPTAVVTSEADEGIYQAMNRGIHLASGELLYFLNCGDQFASDDALNSVLEGASRETAPALVACRVRHHSGGSSTPFLTATIPFNRARLIIGRQDYNHQALLFGRKAVLSAGGFDPKFGVASDYHLILRLALLARPLEVNVVLADYEGGGISTLRPQDIPRLQAWARSQVFDLSGVMQFINSAYGAMTAIRRRELVARHRFHASRASSAAVNPLVTR